MLKKLRQTAIHAANTPVFGSVLRTMEKVDVARAGDLAVVTYHRVDHADRTPLLYPGLISATPERFADQLDMLSSVGQVVSMQQVVAACRGEAELPRKAVLITFDDACRDFAEHAWPALQARRLPVTLFVPTAYPDQPQRQFWWDRLYVAIWHGRAARIHTAYGQWTLDSDEQRRRAYRALRDQVKQLPHEPAMQLVDEIVLQQQAPSPPASVLGWDELRELATQGVTLAPHTQTHPLLTQVSIDQARAEVVGSREDLQRELGGVLPVFAYPGGQCNAAVKEMLAEEGFELAFTVQRGINRISKTNRLALNRINVGQQTSVQILRAQLSVGWWGKRVAAG
ncbi:polysaccharide deacetylase family protein [Roseimaritima ulvae]|uniref:Polysaccharide deacetylase n=1 Tax=Roseimaritima ulvae TaxID=980254 RepID=A0A5B9QVA9_9BACT|nr:polysaccharide deacetylase family protein [Roseimaritima ulvae]QEG41892.1 Polysaccharide deacetylase [Roseimaritima ulvae]